MKSVAKEFREFVKAQDANREVDHWANNWNGCFVGHFLFETGRLEDDGKNLIRRVSVLEIFNDDEHLHAILNKPSEATERFPTYGDLQKYFEENE